jgi:ribose transport system substrate-binding protein
VIKKSGLKPGFSIMNVMRLLISSIVVLGVSFPCWSGVAKVIGVSLLTRQHQFFTYLEDGLRTESEKKGYELQVKAGEYDMEKQAAQIAEFIEKKVDAMVLAPCDSRSVGNPIALANKANIPVFTVDIANISPVGKVLSHIASDNLEGGRKAAALMADALQGTGKIVIINHPNITSVMDRITGFREAMRAYPGIGIIAEIPAWGLRDRAMSIMEDVLMNIPDVNGVFAINDNSALGAMDAIEAAGKKVIIVSYDAIPEVQKDIDQGKIFGAVIQYPEKIGAITIKTIADYFAGRKIPPVVLVPVGVRTKNAS